MPGQERVIDPVPAHIAMIARVGVQRLFLGREGVEQRESGLAIHVLVVPWEQELDRDGDPSGRLDQGLLHDKPPAEDRGGDPGLDRRQRYSYRGAQGYATAIADRRFGADLGKFLEGVQGRPPFWHGTLRQ